MYPQESLKIQGVYFFINDMPSYEMSTLYQSALWLWHLLYPAFRGFLFEAITSQQDRDTISMIITDLTVSFLLKVMIYFTKRNIHSNHRCLLQLFIHSILHAYLPYSQNMPLVIVGVWFQRQKHLGALILREDTFLSNM